MIGNLKNEISRLQNILEEKERHIENLRDEHKKLVDHYRKVADDLEKTFREEKLSLEKQINKNKEDLLIVEKENEKLTRNKNDLENEVEHKSNVIRKLGKEIVEKEQKMREAIEESNRLSLIIDTLKQQHSAAMVEDRKMSMKIEALESQIDEKEKTIINLRNNKTMTCEEIEEELGKITKGHGKKLDNQTGMIEQLNEQIDSLTASAKQKNEQIDSLTASAKQQNEQIDSLTGSAKQQNEKLDFITDTLMKVLSPPEKK